MSHYVNYVLSSYNPEEMVDKHLMVEYDNDSISAELDTVVHFLSE